MIVFQGRVADGFVTIELVEASVRFGSVRGTNTATVPARVRVWIAENKQYEEVIPAQSSVNRSLPANPRIADYINSNLSSMFHIEAA